MAAAKTSRILSKTLSTLNEHRNQARQQRSHSQPAIQIHASLTEEFGPQLDFHTRQAEELRVKSREVETLRCHLKTLRSAAEDVAQEYERLGDRTSKMNASLSSLLSHLLEQPQAGANHQHQHNHRLSAVVAGSPELLKSVDPVASALPGRTSFVSITDFDPASPRETPSPTPSASSVAVRFRHRRRSKEALMKAIRSYVQEEAGDDDESALEEDDDDAEMSAFVGDPNTSWSFFDSERGPLQKGSRGVGRSASSASAVHGHARTPSPTTAAATTATTNATTAEQNQQHLDTEVLTHLMLVVHEMQQYLVQACQQTNVHLSAEFTTRLTNFIKGDIRTVRYTSQEYFKSLGEYQSCLKSLNQMAANAHGGDAAPENDHPSAENERAGGGGGSGTGSGSGNVASLRLAQLRNTVQRIRPNNDIAEAKRLQHVRASTVTASEHLQSIGEDCLVYLDSTEAGLEVTTLPQTLVSYIKTLRRLFENGIKKCDGLLSNAEIDSIDALLRKRQKESLETRKSKQAVRRQTSEEAITLREAKSGPSLAATTSRNSYHSKVEDAIQSFANASVSSPKGPPPLPPKRKDVDSRSPSHPPPNPPPTKERKSAASPPLPLPPVPNAAKPSALKNKTESPTKKIGLVEQRLQQLNANSSVATNSPPVTKSSSVVTNSPPVTKSSSVTPVSVATEQPSHAPPTPPKRQSVPVAEWAALPPTAPSLPSPVDTSLVRLLMDPEFHLLKCIMDASNGLSWESDSPTLSATCLRHLNSTIKIHECMGTLSFVVENILKQDRFSGFLKQFEEGPWSYPRLIGGGEHPDGKRYTAKDPSDAIARSLIKQAFVQQGKYFLGKVVGNLCTDVHALVRDSKVDGSIDMQHILELAKKVLKDMCTHRGLLPRIFREWGHFVATAMNEEAKIPRATSSFMAEDQANQLLAMLFLHDFLLPAIRAPHEWNLVTPWDSKQVHRLYGCTHREYSSSSMPKNEWPLPKQYGRILENISDLISEVIGFVTGLSLPGTGMDSAMDNDHMDISMALAANSLVGDVELYIQDFLQYLSQENRVMSMSMDGKASEADRIGGFMLSQELEILMEHHLMAADFKIRKWVEENSQEEDGLVYQEMQSILKRIQPVAVEKNVEAIIVKRAPPPIPARLKI